MKKVLIALVAISMAVGVQADFLINYTAGFGFSSDYASDPAGGIPLLGNGEQARVQLIYAGVNGVADYLSVTGNGLGNDYTLGFAGAVYNDDAILADFLTAAAVGGDFVTEFGVFTEAVQSAYEGGGHIYGRIFNAAGTLYYEDAIVVAPNLDPNANPAPTAFKYELDDGGNGAFIGLQENGDMYSVIPEPATFGLMAVAGLGMFLARKKSRR